jgi:ElaB/YqjD/DUF883 family membrane-anchored ribosome-binding protein
MTAQADVAAVREEVLQTRAHISDTLAEIDARIAGQVSAVKQRLDPMEWARQHPWLALATATGVGLAVSATRADKKALAAAAAGARQAGNAAISSALHTPSLAQRALHGVGGYVDTLAASVLLGFIERLREPQQATPTTQATSTETPAAWPNDLTATSRQMEEIPWTS